MAKYKFHFATRIWYETEIEADSVADALEKFEEFYDHKDDDKGDIFYDFDEIDIDHVAHIVDVETDAELTRFAVGKSESWSVYAVDEDDATALVENGFGDLKYADVDSGEWGIVM